MGIEFSIGDSERTFYRGVGYPRIVSDDGFVGDVITHRKGLEKLYREKDPLYDHINKGTSSPQYQGKQPVGEHMFRIAGGISHHHIYMANQDDALKNLRTRAHEEGHLLSALSRLDLVSERFREDLGLMVDFKDLGKDEEATADLCAILGLKKRGFGFEDLPKGTEPLSPLALRIYQESERNRTHYQLPTLQRSSHLLH